MSIEQNSQPVNRKLEKISRPGSSRSANSSQVSQETPGAALEASCRVREGNPCWTDHLAPAPPLQTIHLKGTKARSAEIAPKAHGAVGTPDAPEALPFPAGGRGIVHHCDFPRRLPSTTPETVQQIGGKLPSKAEILVIVRDIQIAKEDGVDISWVFEDDDSGKTGEKRNNRYWWNWLGAIKEDRRIDGCEKTGNVIEHLDCEAKVVIVHHCDSRFCRVCAKRLRAEAVGRYLTVFDQAKQIGMITFTQGPRSQLDELPRVTERLLKNFERLRRRKIPWKFLTANKRRKKGKRPYVFPHLPGVWGLEFAYDKETDSWHVHLHVLMYWEFANFDVIKAVWGELCGGDTWWHFDEVKEIVGRNADGSPVYGKPIHKIRDPKKRRSAIREVLKYVVKGNPPLEQKFALMALLCNRKTMFAFGGAKIKEEDSDAGVPLCPRCAEPFTGIGRQSNYRYNKEKKKKMTSYTGWVLVSRQVNMDVLRREIIEGCEHGDWYEGFIYDEKDARPIGTFARGSPG